MRDALRIVMRALLVFLSGGRYIVQHDQYNTSQKRIRFIAQTFFGDDWFVACGVDLLEKQSSKGFKTISFDSLSILSFSLKENKTSHCVKIK